MSRSFKHTPIIGIAGSSEKNDKRFANRRLRTHVRRILHSDADNIGALPILREVSNVYSFSKDGRRWMPLADRPHLKKFMRK